MNNTINIGSRTFLEPKHILMIKADMNYSYVYLQNGEIIYSSTTLGTIEKRLANTGYFARVHHSYLINTRLLKYSKPGEYVVFEGIKFLVSRRKAKVFPISPKC